MWTQRLQLGECSHIQMYPNAACSVLPSQTYCHYLNSTEVLYTCTEVFARCVWTQASCLSCSEENIMFLFENMKIVLHVKHWPDYNCSSNLEQETYSGIIVRHLLPAQTLCTLSYSNTPNCYNASGSVFQIYLWPTFWQILLKLLTVSKHNITAMQMTYVLSQCAKKYRSALPEGGVSLDLLLSFSGHMLPPNAMEKIC